MPEPPTYDPVCVVEEYDEGMTSPHGQSIKDADFIAACRYAVPELIAEVRHLRSILERFHISPDSYEGWTVKQEDAK